MLKRSCCRRRIFEGRVGVLTLRVRRVCRGNCESEGPLNAELLHLRVNSWFCRSITRVFTR